MKPFVKWPGGKHEEYKIIKKYFPKKIDKYVEPFIGGGAVYLAIAECKTYYINDKSIELINLYKMIKEQNKFFFNKLDDILYNWRLIEKIVDKHNIELIDKYLEYSNGTISEVNWSDFIVEFILKNKEEFNGILESTFNIDIKHFIDVLNKNFLQKTKRMKMLEIKNGELSREDLLRKIETAFKSSYYKHFRHLYNEALSYKISEEFRNAIFYFIREFCYSSMFRYNKSGKFNVPYGGISYNRKNVESKIDDMKNKNLISRLNNTVIMAEDFQVFLEKIKLTEKDFIFLDPPYDTEFSSYANSEFDRNDQKRLVKYLKETKAKFMLVIKNTEYISSLYQKENFYIKVFNKKYLVSFQNRNNKEVEHLIITNYEI